MDQTMRDLGAMGPFPPAFRYRGERRTCAPLRTATEAKPHPGASMVALAARLGRLGAWELRVDAMTLAWSAEALALLAIEGGWPLELGRAVEFIHADWRDGVVKAVHECIRTGRAFDLEIPACTSAGRELWLRIIGEAEAATDGRVLHVQGAIQDITDSRLGQQALAASEERYRLLFETSVDAILQTSPDGRILRANAAACAMFGLTGGQLLQLGKSDLVAAGEHGLCALRDDRARQGQAAARLRMVRADGTVFHAEATSNQQRTSSGELLTHTILRDVTGTHLHEKEVLLLNAMLSERVEQRTAELERANDQLKSFAHSLAHDLRAPVAAIKGFAVPLQERLAEIGTDRDQLHLGRIQAAADRMDDFIEGLLECATITQAQLRVQDVDLTAMSRSIVTELEERHGGRRVRVDIQDGLHAIGDARLLRMCMENLIGNAWKFTGNTADAEIHVAAYHTLEGELVYFVKDNGAGFDMAFADKLFGNFQRLHTESEFPGTGLGLANVQRIVQRHGGRIWAEAVEGEGATFNVTLDLLMTP